MTYSGEREVLGYDGDQYRQGQGLVREARQELDELIGSNQNYHQILYAVTKAIIGTRKASDAIHHPAATHLECNEIVNRTKSLGSPGDFATDSKGLETIEKFMDPDILVLPKGRETSLSSW